MPPAFQTRLTTSAFVPSAAFTPAVPISPLRDGSTRFLRQTLSPIDLTSLCVRDDGQAAFAD